MIEIGVDVGGTFTDVVVSRDEVVVRFIKVPSTPSDPIQGVCEGVRQVLDTLKLKPGQIGRFVHGSTVAINALIQKKGATTGVLTTDGFEDVLEIGRHKRSRLYDLFLDAETPTFLAPRRRRAGVVERIAADGSIVTPLDEGSVRSAVQRLLDQKVESIAVCFLFSFRNAQHEIRAREIIREMDPNVHVSLSSEVDPAFREYERTVMTALDAFLHGAVGDYVHRLRVRLQEMGFVAKLQVMQSRGGLTSAQAVARQPMSLLLSGLAAGVVGSKHVITQANQKDAISLDIGGTSCDIALIRSGTPIVTNQTRVARFPLRMQMVDVNTIGAGGGSIAWVDDAGRLRVGPQSAGADPGPACYGRGGQKATVTDASLVLGYLNPDTFAGGVQLDKAAAERVVQQIADEVGLGLFKAASGIHRIVNSRMSDEVRRVTVQRGFDPRQFVLLPLGGAGPIHGCAIAADLNMAGVVVPETPGVLSAFGLLVADVEHDQMETFAELAHQVDREKFAGVFDRLTTVGQTKMQADGVGLDDVEIRRQADMRYAGQSHELTIGVSRDSSDPLSDAVAAFHDLHTDIYGHANRSAPIEFVNLRTVHVSRRASAHGERPAVAAKRKPGVTGQRDVYFDEAEGFVATPIYNRTDLVEGKPIMGPAIIEQSDTTLIVHPRQRATLRADRSIFVEVNNALQ
jgi:N-methylhydantoinase A